MTESIELLDADNLPSFKDAGIEASNTTETWSIDALSSVPLGRYPDLVSAHSTQAVSEASARSAAQRAPFGLNFDLQEAMNGATSPLTYGFILDGLWKTDRKRDPREKKARILMRRLAIGETSNGGCGQKYWLPASSGFMRSYVYTNVPRLPRPLDGTSHSIS